MVSKLSNFVANKIVSFIHEQGGFAVIVCDESGIIMADSAQTRVGVQHKGSHQIMTTNIEYTVVTQEEADVSNGKLKGYNQAIKVDGVKIGTFGIAGPLDIVSPVARIAAGMVVTMLRDEELKDIMRNQVKVLSNSIERAASAVQQTAASAQEVAAISQAIATEAKEEKINLNSLQISWGLFVK